MNPDKVKAITKRVKRAHYYFDTHDKCFVCGDFFQVCKHNVSDNDRAIELVKMLEIVS